MRPCTTAMAHARSRTQAGRPRIGTAKQGLVWAPHRSPATPGTSSRTTLGICVTTDPWSPCARLRSSLPSLALHNASANVQQETSLNNEIGPPDSHAVEKWNRTGVRTLCQPGPACHWLFLREVHLRMLNVQLANLLVIPWGGCCLP